MLDALPAGQALVALAVGAKATLNVQLALAGSEAAHEEFAIVKSPELPAVKLAATPLMAPAVLLLSSNGCVGLVPPITWSQKSVEAPGQDAGGVSVTPVAGTPMPLNFSTCREP